MSLKSKIIDIINDEAKKVLNEYYAIYNTKSQNNVGVSFIDPKEFDAETASFKGKTKDGKQFTGIKPGNSPLGPGKTAMVVGTAKASQVIYSGG